MNLEYHNYRITTDAYNYIVTKKIFSKSLINISFHQQVIAILIL